MQNNIEIVKNKTQCFMICSFENRNQTVLSYIKEPVLKNIHLFFDQFKYQQNTKIA